LGRKRVNIFKFPYEGDLGGSLPPDKMEKSETKRLGGILKNEIQNINNYHSDFIAFDFLFLH
jgi:hypothetical protein